jgi:citrate lyase subunit beta/citryl-CoA lyase
MARDDLDAILSPRPDGVVLPKSEAAESVAALAAMMSGRDDIRILPIATETPAAIFGLGGYWAVRDRLAGLTWGADDLPAAIGAACSRENDGSYTAPYQVARALTLFAAHAAGAPAIEAVFPAFRDAGPPTPRAATMASPE